MEEAKKEPTLTLREQWYEEQMRRHDEKEILWRKQYEKEMEILDKLPKIEARLDNQDARFEQHIKDEQEYRERESAAREKAQNENKVWRESQDAKLDAILDIKSKAVFLWRVAKIVGTITIGILTFLKLIIPFLKPVIETWIRHLSGR